MEIFKVQLNCIDSYQATPSPLDPQLRKGVQPSDLHKEPKVPVIRVFGSTETGQKVCAHIHGAFPYLYIEYDGSLEPEEGRLYSSQQWLRFSSRIISWDLYAPVASLHRLCP